MNLIELIQIEMQNDDADTDRQSEILLNRYLGSSPEEKFAIDDVSICICGWSLSSMIKKLDGDGRPR